MNDIRINNRILREFLDPVTSTEPYKLRIDKEGIEYEIMREINGHMKHKTRLSPTAMERFVVSESLSAELPLKRMKDFLRKIVPKDATVDIVHDAERRELICTIDGLEHKIKYSEIKQHSSNPGLEHLSSKSNPCRRTTGTVRVRNHVRKPPIRRRR